jgi:hypothetical protein
LPKTLAIAAGTLPPKPHNLRRFTRHHCRLFVHDDPALIPCIADRARLPASVLCDGPFVSDPACVMTAMAALEADALLTAADVACIQDVHPFDRARAGQFCAIKQHPRAP